MKVQLDTCEAERKSNRKLVQALEDRVENLERKSRSCSIEIRNITYNPTEKKQDLQLVVKNICAELKLPIIDAEIRDVFSLSSRSKNTPSPVIVEFTSASKKEELGPSTTVYVSDNLTPKMKHIYYLARNFARNNELKYCWTSHGNVYLRKTDGSPAVRINNEEDMDTLKSIK
ncbi:hypothetical protein ACJJTC_019157 [Scirpophaga incertulas]